MKLPSLGREAFIFVFTSRRRHTRYIGDWSSDVCSSDLQRLTIEIAAAAASLGRTIEMDMEGTAYTDLTLDIFEATRRRFDNVGLAIQASLYRTEKDIEPLAPLAPKFRPVKGA